MRMKTVGSQKRLLVRILFYGCLAACSATNLMEINWKSGTTESGTISHTASYSPDTGYKILSGGYYYPDTEHGSEHSRTHYMMALYHESASKVYYSSYDPCEGGTSPATYWATTIYDPTNALKVEVAEADCLEGMCFLAGASNCVVVGGGARYTGTIDEGVAVKYIAASFPCQQNNQNLQNGDIPTGWCAQGFQHKKNWVAGKFRISVTSLCWQNGGSAGMTTSLTTGTISTVDRQPLNSVSVPPGFAVVSGGAVPTGPSTHHIIVSTYPVAPSTWTAQLSSFCSNDKKSGMRSYALGLKVVACLQGTYLTSDASGNYICAEVDAGCYGTKDHEFTSCPAKCPAGTYNPNKGSKGSATNNPCLPCPDATYSSGGASACTMCSPTKCTLQSNPPCHWVGGGTSQSKCACEAYYTGDDCEFTTCSTELKKSSLISLYFNADKNLRQYTKSFNSTSTQLEDAESYLQQLLGVDMDVDGDQFLSKEEVSMALSYRSVSVDMNSLPLWCEKAIPESVCYNVGKISVASVYENAVANFYSDEHTFDGSGLFFVSGMESTFPDPSWNDDTCAMYDSFQTKNPNAVTTTWNFDASKPSIYRVCGYTNGNLTSAFISNSDLFKGVTTTFVDNEPISGTGYKRVYCISIDFCWEGICDGSNPTFTTRFECSVGLFYDGTPLDLEPVLTSNGITFSYLDTSSSEYEFDIFVGDYQSPASAKSFVVGIPYPSSGCGRHASHISFTDKENSHWVGQIREYAIRAIQYDANDNSYLTDMTVMPYRIPFYVKVSGQVKTKANVGVQNVVVSYCHIDPDTGVNDEDVNFCPYAQFTTDVRGYYSGEIRVSNVKWRFTVEDFNVTAALTETLIDGSTVVHAFDPPYAIASLDHDTGRHDMSITDNTTVSVFGSIKWDPLIVNNKNCPIESVPVVLVDATGATTQYTTDSDGKFTFSITQGTQAYIYIPEYGGHTWKSNISTTSSNAGTMETRRRRLARSGARSWDRQLIQLAPALANGVASITTAAVRFEVAQQSAVMSSLNSYWGSVTAWSGWKMLGGGYYYTNPIRENSKTKTQYLYYIYPETETMFVGASDHVCGFDKSNHDAYVFMLQLYDPNNELVVQRTLRVCTTGGALCYVERVPGCKLVGGGVTISDGSTSLEASYPCGEGGVEIENGAEPIAWCGKGLTSTATVYALSLCWASGGSGSIAVIVTTATSTSNSEMATTSVGVPSGYTLIGGGARVVSNSGNTALISSYPSSNQWTATVAARCGNDQKREVKVWSIGFRITSQPTFQPTSKPTSKPTAAPTYAPTFKPTYTPTFKPTTVPTYAPTKSPSATPTSRPTLKPTLSQFPTSIPTSIPTSDPTSMPSAIPTVKIGNESSQTIHIYTFASVNVSDTGHTITYDTVTGDAATLYGKVAIANGKAEFNYVSGLSVPYIEFPIGTLGTSDIVTIEVWVSFDDDNDPAAVLFSFGEPGNYFSVASGHSGEKLYVALILDTGMGECTLYIEGIFAQTMPFQGTFPIMRLTQGFLGRSVDLSESTVGLRAKVEEFRVTHGGLTSAELYSNYIIGVDPSHITIPSSATSSNVKVEFFATTKQLIEVGMYGGTQAKTKMFGSDTVFQLAAASAKCAYHVEYAIHTDGEPFLESLPAMNYTVMMISDPPTPVFGAESCSLLHPSTPCVCAESKSPLEYLEDADALVQNITIIEANTGIYNVSFIYQSGLCLEVVNAEYFPTTSGDTSTLEGFSCFDNDRTNLEKGDKWSLNIYLFERYPEGTDYLYRTQKDYLATAYMTETYVPNATLSVVDLVSGLNSAQTLPYNSSMEFKPYALVETPVGVTYIIEAGDPLTMLPYSLKFQVEAVRDGPDGISSVSETWYVPVLGPMAKEVPNYYPVAGDPNLIFMVLRDPPGGGSYTTIHAGTTITFGLQVGEMYTSDSGVGVESVTNVGSAQENSFLTIAIVSKTFEHESTVAAGYSYMHSESTERASNTHFEHSYTFEYDLSTSDDPFTAGQPSDIIMGGGVDLVVSEAMDVHINITTPSMYCLKMKDTYLWHPGKVTTFVLPVMEIEAIVIKLQRIADSEGLPQQERTDLLQQIDNWNTVLATYRNHTASYTELFTADQKILLSFLNAFYDFQLTRTGSGQLLGYLSLLGFMGGNDELAKSFAELGDTFVETYFAARDTCKYAKYGAMAQVCKDFSPEKWKTFKFSLDDACAYHTIVNKEEDNNVAKLEAFSILSSMCASSAYDHLDNIPGGIDGNVANSMFGFLDDSTKYITFGAQSPLTMSYTSASSEGLNQEASYTDSKENTVSGGINTDMLIAAVKLQEELLSSSIVSDSVTVGRVADSAHDYERTVSITLADSDIGDYFAVRITEDPVFGTPVFTTMGGQSKCPGETATSRRESGVSIHEIKHMCGPNHDQSCSMGEYPKVGDDAYFSVVIKNLSPTEDVVTYGLQLESSWDTLGSDLNSPACGSPGRRAGLTATFMETELQEIPFNTLIEVPFSVSRQDMNLCDEFKDISVLLYCSCEASDSSTQVYQYGVFYDKENHHTEVLYDEDSIIRGGGSSATFSVKWVPRTKGGGNGDDDISTASSNANANSCDDVVPEINKRLFIVVGIICGFNICFFFFVLLCICQPPRKRSRSTRDSSSKEDTFNSTQDTTPLAIYDSPLGRGALAMREMSLKAVRGRNFWSTKSMSLSSQDGAVRIDSDDEDGDQHI